MTTISRSTALDVLALLRQRAEEHPDTPQDFVLPDCILRCIYRPLRNRRGAIDNRHATVPALLWQTSVSVDGVVVLAGLGDDDVLGLLRGGPLTALQARKQAALRAFWRNDGKLDV